MAPIWSVTLQKKSALSGVAAAFAVISAYGLASAQNASPRPQLSYADLADLSAAASIVGQVRVRAAERIKPAPGVAIPLGRKRFLITADVVALIRGSGGLPPQIQYLVDVPDDAKGKTPKLKKAEMIIFAVAVPKRASEIQLIAPDAQIVIVPGLADQVRAIVSAQTGADAPPRISGVGDAFHVAGSLSGQGETQIFLITDDRRPASLSIWREPGLKSRWAVSLDEIVDSGGTPPAPGTLLWYRLACFLPRTLSPDNVAALDPASAQIAVEDYQTVLDGLGKCERTRR
jgi:hypothetical protein